MKAYKVFNSDWTCRDFQYEVGKTYEIESKPVLCRIGFHACKKAVDCFNYYKFDNKNKVAEVELLGDIVGQNDDKQATNKIKIIREIKWNELLSIVNTGSGNTGNYNSGNYNSGNCNSGDYNSGHYNSGNYNSGYRNSGDYNSGDYNSGNYNSGYRNSGHYNSGHYNSGNYNSGNCNSGDYNSGNYNSGYRNSGDYNSGNYNSGHYNSGDYNSGNCNSGHYNSGHYNSGDYNTKEPEKMYMFNKLLNKSKVDEIRRSEGYYILRSFCLYKYRVKTQSGKFGDYIYMSYKQSWKIFWRNLTIKQRLSVKKIPYFDSDVFFEITGILVK